jgi:hypothetical protein
MDKGKDFDDLTLEELQEFGMQEEETAHSIDDYDDQDEGESFEEFHFNED